MLQKNQDVTIPRQLFIVPCDTTVYPITTQKVYIQKQQTINVIFIEEYHGDFVIHACKNPCFMVESAEYFRNNTD